MVRISRGAIIVLAAVLLCGCAHRAAPPKAKPAAKESVPLPEWAPTHPSPEFLRAARVLRGVPMDVAGRGDVPEQTWRAMLAYMKRVNPTLWELFGSMSDDQIERFLETKRASLPVRSLTPAQRGALDAVLDANKDNKTEIAGVTLGDFRTLLYKMGAERDLSNVTIGFTIEGANTLSFNARVAGNSDPLQWTGWAQAPRLGPQRPTEGSVPQAKGSVPLPAWAPENPSPEFLRAAKVLRPIPADMMQNAGEAMQVPAAILKRYERWWPAGWEFFGTLSDAQIEQVLETKFLRVHVRDLTPKQRQAFEAFMDAIDSALAGASRPEYRVSLYKFGAKTDLSNVDVGFDIDAHALLIRTWVPTPGAAGKSITTGDAFATL